MLGEQLPFFEHLLLATDQLGSHIPGSTCEWTWWDVEVRDQQSIYATDATTMETQTLPRRDAVVFRVNVPLIFRSICRAADWRWDYHEVREAEGLSRIAVDSHSPSVQLSIFYASGDLDASLVYLAAVSNKPCVIFRSSGGDLDANSQLMLQRMQSIELALPQCTELGDRGIVTLNDSAMQRLTDFRRQHIPPPEPKPQNQCLDVPAGTTWNSVQIHFVDYETIRVSVPGSSGIYHYTQLGMANSRNAKPVKQWQLLRTYADNHGVLTWRDSGAAQNVKKQTQELNKKLIASLGIEGTSIEYDRSIKGYRTVFRIEADG
ncbi:hypothetical protein [Rhodopirellula halodulae]|uniref:hypothetical protein n=1 Tax=Rhodopirellula halodulae TaxID=2894198 RepID=UPI001E4D7C86|nr:hypothetical protein [Rhodopirellula sp. JC737]MCC9654664.1 hypothetical protein [Rhodopirellula sp. JC737]